MNNLGSDKNLLVNVYASQQAMSKIMNGIKDNTIYTKEYVNKIFEVLQDVKEENERVAKKYNELVRITNGKQAMEESLSDKIYADAELHGVKKNKVDEVYELIKRSIRPYILGIQSVDDIVNLEIFIDETFEGLKKLNPKFFEKDSSYIDPNHNIKAIRVLSKKLVETKTKYITEKNKVLELKQKLKLKEDDCSKELNALKNEYIDIVNNISVDYGL